ncbi:MAG: RNA 2',3'-cyclic phosphodiesterase [Candidatus Omnitrophica bacterium]|nr:RNA 2',3'-cyclic phosphodiesterase [Candidatus Omnitrophota bacterium]
MRGFLAFPISGELKEEFERLLGDLKKTGADTSWVKPENIHLTLKFLGDIEPEDLKKITAVLTEQASRFSVFASYLTEIDAFPDLHHPKIIWAGLDDSIRTMETIVRVLENELAQCGFSREERPFKPHLTLGRIRSGSHLRNLISAVKQISFRNRIEQQFETIILYQSTLTPQGPVYEALQSFALGKGGGELP